MTFHDPGNGRDGFNRRSQRGQWPQPKSTIRKFLTTKFIKDTKAGGHFLTFVTFAPFVVCVKSSHTQRIPNDCSTARPLAATKRRKQKDEEFRTEGGRKDAKEGKDKEDFLRTFASFCPLLFNKCLRIVEAESHPRPAPPNIPEIFPGQENSE